MAHGIFCPNCMGAVSDRDATCSGCGFARPAAGWPIEEFLGRLVNGKYRVTEILGRGGHGVALLAHQMHGGHDLGPVVLKFLHPHLASRPSLRRRFLNEAKIARALTTPHVVKIFDFAFDEHGLPFIVMEYLQGRSLAELLHRGRIEPARALRIGMQIAQALQVCHAAGIVHRDLKPSNVLLLPGRRDDFVKIIDFGIAYLTDTSGSSTMLGTPKYMPPEQILHEAFDEGVDIYALGVLLFECFAGAPPIAADNPVAYLQLNLSSAPRRLRALAPQHPEALDALLNKMLAKDRRERPPSMADIEARLVALGNKEGWLSLHPVVTERHDVGALLRAQSPLHRGALGEATESVVEKGPEGNTTLPQPIHARAEQTTDAGAAHGRRLLPVLLLVALLAALAGAAGVLFSVLSKSGDPAVRSLLVDRGGDAAREDARSSIVGTAAADRRDIAPSAGTDPRDAGAQGDRAPQRSRRGDRGLRGALSRKPARARPKRKTPPSGSRRGWPPAWVPEDSQGPGSGFPKVPGL